MILRKFFSFVFSSGVVNQTNWKQFLDNSNLFSVDSESKYLNIILVFVIVGSIEFLCIVFNSPLLSIFQKIWRSEKSEG